MSEIKTSNLQTNTLFFLIIIFFGLALYIFHAFLVPVLLAIIFVVTTYPLYKKTLKLFRGHSVVASVVFCFLSLIVLLILLTFIGWLLLGEFFYWKNIAYDQLTVRSDQWFKAQDWAAFLDDNTTKIEHLVAKIPYIDKAMVMEIAKKALEEVAVLAKNFSTQMVNVLTAGLGKIGGLFISLIYFYLAVLFFYIDGERVLQRIFYLLPIKSDYIREIEGRFTSLFKSWVVGNITIMIVQGILAGVGFAIAGIPSPVIWGIIMTFTSLIPFIGSAMIWVPAVILLLISGHYFAGIFLLIWGVAIVGTSDNIIRPIILKGGAHLPLLILFFAIIGGLTTMGFKGLLLGPIILVFLDSLLHIYSLEYKSFLNQLNK